MRNVTLLKAVTMRLANLFLAGLAQSMRLPGPHLASKLAVTMPTIREKCATMEIILVGMVVLRDAKPLRFHGYVQRWVSATSTAETENLKELTYLLAS
jgi:hypothetical protein